VRPRRGGRLPGRPALRAATMAPPSFRGETRGTVLRSWPASRSGAETPWAGSCAFEIAIVRLLRVELSPGRLSQAGSRFAWDRPCGSTEPPMSKSRPCRFCRRWFVPNARARARQVACGRAECQRERHRVACSRWHARERDAARGEGLSTAVSSIAAAAAATPAGRVPTLPEVACRRVRDAVPAEVPVLIAFLLQVGRFPARDAVGTERPDFTGESRKHVHRGQRDAIGPPAAGS